VEDTLIGRTTRRVTFIDKAETARFGHAMFPRTMPAGTEVYVAATNRPGEFRIRIPGTLLEQVVSLSSVEPE
jgi:hypothetical protein